MLMSEITIAVTTKHEQQYYLNNIYQGIRYLKGDLSWLDTYLVIMNNFQYNL